MDEPQSTKPNQLVGRDEMNLAEFAIGLASDRNAKNIKTIEREQTLILSDGSRLDQLWTVTGSDKHGLPRAGDDDVLIALLKLASDQGFKERRVYFSRYEVLQILGWSLNGPSYKRFESSLERLAGVRIMAKNSFWDTAKKLYTSVYFGLIDDYQILDKSGRESDQLEIPLTYVSLNEKFFKSIRDGNLKRLDLALYYALKSAVSKRLYRFLDKRSHRKQFFEVDLYTMASVNLGLDLSTRKYASQVKQLLEPAHQELLEHGFLSDWKYRWSQERETWFVGYSFSGSRQRLAAPAAAPVNSSGSPVEALVSRGLSFKIATRLNDQYPERIASKLDLFDHLVNARSPLVSKNPVGWLRKAIEDDYQGHVPGYQSLDLREKKKRDKETARWKEIEETRRQEARQQELWAQYLDLPEPERQVVLSEARQRLRFLPTDKLETLEIESPILKVEILSIVAARNGIAETA